MSALAASSVSARLASVPGGAAVAAAVPFVFVDIALQPSVSAHGVQTAISDVAVLLVVVFAAWRWAGDRGRLRPGLPIWVASGAFLAWIGLAAVHPRLSHADDATFTHLVTAAKFAEYALLAPAAAVLVRTRRDLELVLRTLAGWCAVATVVAVAQYFGLHVLRAWPAGERQPSFLGVHEYSSLSAATFALGLAALLWPPRDRAGRAFAGVALAAGCVGLVLSGAVAGGVGVLLAAAALVVVGRRRGALTLRTLAVGGALCAVVAAGLLAIRSGDIGALARFVGARPRTEETTSKVQTYAQRSLMAYIGLRMWRDHPLLGVGWQGAREPRNFEPYLPDARARFPDQPAQAFPSREHAYPIDNAFVQALAELGVVGLLAFLAFLVTVTALGFRVGLRGPPGAFGPGLAGLLLFLASIGIWTGQGLVSGTSIDAVAWLGAGLVAAGLAAAEAG